MHDKHVHFEGVFDTFWKVYWKQGLYSFWWGNGLAVAKQFPTQALNFSLKDFYQHMLSGFSNGTQTMTFKINLLAGGLAGASSLSIMYPVEFVWTWLAMDIGWAVKDKEFKGIKDVIIKISSSDGVKGFYKGFCIAVFGVGIYRASYFGCFDTFRPILFGKHSNNIV